MPPLFPVPARFQRSLRIPHRLFEVSRVGALDQIILQLRIFFVVDQAHDQTRECRGLNKKHSFEYTLLAYLVRCYMLQMLPHLQGSIQTGVRQTVPYLCHSDIGNAAF